MILPNVTTRFAPSPTGYLHLGHVYAAKVAHNLAREHNGQYLLRFEDIDTTRTREIFYQTILEDLAWLSIHHDHTPLRQTDRLSHYSAAISTLRDLGILYPCFCSRKDIAKELSHITNAPHGPEGTLYPQTCRNLSQSEIHQQLELGNSPSWRINTSKAQELTGDLTFTDRIHGEITVNHDLLGDVILSRKDIGTSYHIAVVVDDAFQEITHVTRGDDLLPSTHIHAVLQKLLSLPQPIYNHHRLITDIDGDRLAKRNAPLSIKTLREQGHSPEQVLAMI